MNTTGTQAGMLPPGSKWKFEAKLEGQSQSFHAQSSIGMHSSIMQSIMMKNEQISIITNHDLFVFAVLTLIISIISSVGLISRTTVR